MSAFARYCVIGLSGYAVNLAVYSIGLLTLVLHHVLAAAIAFVVAASNNFWWNRHWTFAAPPHRLRLQASRFLVVSVLAFTVGAGILAILVDVLRVPPLPAQAVSIAVVTPLSFLGNRLWTFGALSAASVRETARDASRQRPRPDARRPT